MYGLRSVLYLAQVTDEQHKIGVKDISKYLNVPVHFLAKILQDLARKRLVSSTKGPNGGFYLTEAEKDQSIMTFVNAIDGDLQFTECVLGLKACSHTNPCPLHGSVVKHRDNVLKVMATTTLRDFSVKLDNGEYRLTI